MTYTRKDIVSDFYNQSDENDRLQRTRHGQLEYFTTMTYIHRYADQQSKVLEVGAGTGTVQSSDKRWKIFRKDFETYCDLTNKPWYYRAYILGRRRLMLVVQKQL